MSKPIDEYREDRIVMQVVVDAYNSEERALGWYYYLEGKIDFPFQARWARKKAMSSPHKDNLYTVIGMADIEDCDDDMYVMVEFDDDELPIPLFQLVPIHDVSEASREAICDWHYWSERDYQF